MKKDSISSKILNFLIDKLPKEGNYHELNPDKKDFINNVKNFNENNHEKGYFDVPYENHYLHENENSTVGINLIEDKENFISKKSDNCDILTEEERLFSIKILQKIEKFKILNKDKKNFVFEKLQLLNEKENEQEKNKSSITTITENKNIKNIKLAKNDYLNVTDIHLLSQTQYLVDEFDKCIFKLGKVSLDENKMANKKIRDIYDNSFNLNEPLTNIQQSQNYIKNGYNFNNNLIVGTNIIQNSNNNINQRPIFKNKKKIKTNKNQKVDNIVNVSKYVINPSQNSQNINHNNLMGESSRQNDINKSQLAKNNSFGNNFNYINQKNNTNFIMINHNINNNCLINKIPICENKNNNCNQIDEDIEYEIAIENSNHNNNSNLFETDNNFKNKNTTNFGSYPMNSLNNSSTSINNINLNNQSNFKQEKLFKTNKDIKFENERKNFTNNMKEMFPKDFEIWNSQDLKRDLRINHGEDIKKVNFQIVNIYKETYDCYEAIDLKNHEIILIEDRLKFSFPFKLNTDYQANLILMFGNISVYNITTRKIFYLIDL